MKMFAAKLVIVVILAINIDVGLCGKLRKRVTDSENEITQLKSQVAALKSQIASLVTAPPAAGNGGDSTYVRWGRTTCGNVTGTSLVYDGFTAGSHFTHAGSGSNYQCLPKDHEDPEKVKAGQQSRGGLIYSTEYQTIGGIFSDLHDHDAPCAVCLVEGRSANIMIPAKRSCPAGWTKQYDGYLVSAHYAHQKTTFECLDAAPETIPGDEKNEDGALFYFVEIGLGGSLPKHNYPIGNELACVVCSK